VTHPALRRLTQDLEYPELGIGDHDKFAELAGIGVLFFAGDPARDRETVDVAVVLPELVKAFDGTLRPAIVHRSREVELTLQARYGFREWPTLVFLRDGGYLGAISRVQDWGVYLSEVNLILSSQVRRPPGFKIPVVTE